MTVTPSGMPRPLSPTAGSTRWTTAPICSAWTPPAARFIGNTTWAGWARESPVVTGDGVDLRGRTERHLPHSSRRRDPDAFPLDKEVFERPDGTVDEIFGSPAVVNGRVYFMTRYGIYCLGKADRQVKALEAPPAPRETARPEPGFQGQPSGGAGGGDAETRRADPPERTPIRLGGLASLTGQQRQVVGERRVRIHRSGRDIHRFEPAGVLSGFGYRRVRGRRQRCRTDPDRSPTCRSTKTSSRWRPARCRRAGWAWPPRRKSSRPGATCSRKLASKARPSPPFMRLRAYATPPIPGGYTVEADLMGTLARKRFKPDMGLINSRYRFIMMGMRKRLRIETLVAAAAPAARRRLPLGSGGLVSSQVLGAFGG